MISFATAYEQIQTNMKEIKKKEPYTAPSIELIEMENEGVIAASGESVTQTPMSTRTPNRYNGASSSDLEDMINDILTIEK